MKRWMGLLGWMILCLGVGALSSAFTVSQVHTWYHTLTAPSFAPPNWVFAPVWTALYTMMAVAAWQVSQSPASEQRKWALCIFLIQLGLNFLWSIIFFREHAIAQALVEILVLWLFIGATTLAFSRISARAAMWMVPYWLWVSFAAALNWAFLGLNQA